MKNKRPWPRWTGLGIVAAIICFMLGVMAIKVLPASVDYPLRFVGDYDSVHIIWWEKSGVTWVLEDSVWITSIPDADTSIPLDDSKDWKVDYCYFSGTEEACAGQFIKFTAGAATVSTTDKQEIAGYVRDTLDDVHGVTSWITGGGGTGSDTIVFFALDTSGTDATVEDVHITIFNPSGEDVITGIDTDPDGKFQLKLDPGNNYSAQFRRTGYIFPSLSFNVSGNDDSLPVPGYNIELLASPTPNYCRVQGYVGGASGVVNKAKVTFTIQGEIVNNSCDTMLFIPSTVDTTSDTVGFFYKDLIYSSCLNDLQYLVKAVKESGESKSVLITVPDTSSYRIVW